MTLCITLNGEPKILPETVSVSTLLALLQTKPTQVAVEINRAIVPKSQHDTVQVQNGDNVEIVKFIGGG